MHPADIPWSTLWHFYHYASGDLEDASLFWETSESPIVPNKGLQGRGRISSFQVFQEVHCGVTSV